MRPDCATEYLPERLARLTAFVTIDVQRAFFAIDGSLAQLGYDTTPMRFVLPNIAKLHRLVRNSQSTLVHVRTVSYPGLNWPRHVAPPAMLERSSRSASGKTLCAHDTSDIDFAPEAAPQGSEMVITKHTFDAFQGTPLKFALDNLRVETVVLCGLTTEGCIETTARSALCRGFSVVVVEDAIATEKPEVHRASLDCIAENVGIVASVAEIAMAAGWEPD